jgi:NAD(P)-dependent dehydrogenase (short-subunit alcohol dehydrogenase family)
VTAFRDINFYALPDQLSHGIEDLEESRICITLASRRKWVMIRSTYPAAGMAYWHSKQANRLLTVAFAARLQPYGVKVNACHPGDANSRLSNDLGFGGQTTPD